MTKTLTAFISYSHLNEHALERLTKHLSVLRRDRVVAEWHDQKISAGGDIDASISSLLESCDLFIPLVSADFLASPYCYDREMTTALERHAAGALRVVPVIIEPCDWQNSPLGKLKALPKDGRPISEWTNANTGWLDVVQQIRRLAEEANTTDNGTIAIRPERRVNSSRYRAKRDFDDVDRMEFRERAFAVIRDYFKEASAEIAGVEDLKSKFTVMSDDAFTCTVVNRGRDRAVAHITVHARTGGRISFGDISYSFTERAEPNVSHGWIEICSDEYELHLKKQSMSRSDDSRENFSPNQMAEQLWKNL